jgi:hypothetical protein
MVVRQEQVSGMTEGRQSKKRWLPPEVTRLEFPKTANTLSGMGVDGVYGNFHVS